MLSQVFLCLLVGFATASDYAWKSNTEYQYQVYGRTLTGLHEVSDQYAGVLLKAQLHLRLSGQGVLVARISQAQYAQLHAQLPDGWDSEIKESQLSYHPMHLSQKPFEIKFKNGTVQELYVEKDTPNWEANILKSIVSQLQVDAQGENMIKSRYNQVPEQYSPNDAVYKTMEDSVTGKCETLYDINRLPEYILQTQPELAPLPHLKGDGYFIDVVKTRNYSNCDERVGFHYGFSEMHDWEPASAAMGDFFLKSSVSRIVLSGNLKRHTIQSSFTTNKIIMNPTPGSTQKGMVVSYLNITLVDVKSASGETQHLSQPKLLGNLVYRYNSPFAASNEAREGSKNSVEHTTDLEGSSSSESSSSSEEHRHGAAQVAYDDNQSSRFNVRQRRSAYQQQQQRDQASSSSSDSSTSQESNENWQQNKPTLTSPPESPLLPEFIGYMGKAIKSAQNVKITEAVQKITQQIAHELQTPSQMPKEDTLAKFTILYKFIRTMSAKEIQDVSREIYSLKTKEERQYSDAWKVYRDAVAQAGTGPALITVQDWILTGKISGQEAATVLATLAYSTRQPTEEYMRTFYVLVTKPEVKQHAILNDTAILSFTELVRKVYVSKEESHNQYPVHSFGKFYKKNNEVVATEYIPYLAKQLKEAVQDADSHKIQVYIRALGNVAERQILAVFEPYLEGKKDVSQFQRLFMVVAMDQLVMQYPKVARSVLYRIYQNQGEATEIRVAAVYQLMKTSPPASMLQRMAESTNEEVDDDVNAAVKTSIQYAAQLQDPTYLELATNAQAAAPLLTPQVYGIQQSRQYLKDYAVREMNLIYKQYAAYLGSDDSIIPQGFMYSLRSNMGGVKRQYMNFAAMVSNVEDLFYVLQHQTQQDEPVHYQSAKQQSKWASEYLARFLNINTDESEQLEGNLHFGIGSVKRFYSFDNHTIEQLPGFLKEFSSTLRQGSEFNYTKFFSPYEMTLSFPTAMGLPFVYTLENPTLLSINGEISVKTHPEIVSGHTIQTPQTVNMTADVHFVLSTKTQAKIGFVTPFDHQHYVAGYDKKIQMYLPVRHSIDYDTENQQIYAEFEPIYADKNEQIFHYSSYPYTAKHDLLQLQPLSRLPTSQIVHIREPKQMQATFGEKTGMAFRVQYKTENKYLDARSLYEHYQQHEGISALLAPFTEDYLAHSEFSLHYDADHSDAHSVIVQMGWNQTYYSGKQGSADETFDKIFSQSHSQHDSEYRQQYYLKKAAAGINSADASVYDFSVQFEGKKYSTYNATVAIGKSTVDKKSHVLFYYNQDSQQDKYFEMCLSAHSQIPNTNGLNFMYALKFDPTSTSNVQFAFGENCQSGSKVNIKSKLYKSEQRQRYLQSLPMAKLCAQEMEHGNYQLEACRNMTTRANFFDRYNFDISYEKFSPLARNLTYKLYSAARHLGYYNMDENIFAGHGQDGQVKVQAYFEPDFKTLNVSLYTDKMQTQFYNIRVNEYIRPIVAVHPVFSAYTRFSGYAQNMYFNPTCVVDKHFANTFDNTTYPINFGKAWHVLMHYRTNYAGQQEHHQQEHSQSRFMSEDDFDYSVLSRDSGNDQKDVKIVVNNEKYYWEIDMIPSGGKSESHSGSNPAGQVLVNQKTVQFNNQYSYDIEQGLVKIFALPNGEVKIEINDDFYVIYDGQRVKLTTTESDQFRGDVRGICGTFDGQEATDFLTPRNCILRNPYEFAATYAIIDETAQGPAKEYQARANKSVCYRYTDVSYSNVISEYDAQRTQSGQKYQSQQGHGYGHGQGNTASCSKLQTQYVEEEQGQTICFTVRALPVCRSPCSATKKIVKNVEVHCVQKSNVSDLWMKQIEKGASPDFSLKPVHKTIKIKVAQTCSA